MPPYLLNEVEQSVRTSLYSFVKASFLAEFTINMSAENLPAMI